MSLILDILQVPTISGLTTFTTPPVVNGAPITGTVVTALTTLPTVGATKPNVASVTFTDVKTIVTGTNVTLDAQIEVTSTAIDTPSYFTFTLPSRTANFSDYRVGIAQAMGVPASANLSAAQTAGFVTPKQVMNTTVLCLPGTAVAQVAYTSPHDMSTNASAVQRFRVLLNYTAA